MSFTHLSLFSGIGGIDLAGEWAGFQTVQFVEKDSFCQKILRKNFPGVPIHDDVLTFNGKEYEGTIDLLSAGFPCQPFSMAGKRRGSNDERSLWGEVERIISEVKPRWFVGENVPGLLTSERGAYFGRILASLEQLRYSTSWLCLSAKEVGAVHQRKRIFIVAYSNVLRYSGDADQKWEQFISRREAQCRFERYDPSISGGDASYSYCEQSSVEKCRGSRCRGKSSCNCSGKMVLQGDWETSPEVHSKRSNDGEARCYREIHTGNWRDWSVKPVIYEASAQPRIRRGYDGISRRVDRIKSLGNAVVPQQIFPILYGISTMLKYDKELENESSQ